MASLLVIRGPGIGLRYELGERTTIGRTPECDILLDDPQVSRVHAEIVQNRMAYTIRDLDSKNGVQVNGRQVQEHLLLKSDEVQIGESLLAFNSDLQIRNARFSNTSVYLYPVREETIAAPSRAGRISNLSGSDNETVALLLQLAELFSGAPAPVGETAERLLRHLVELLMADSGALLWKEASGESMRPVYAYPEDAPFRISRQIVAMVAEEKQALLISEAPGEFPRISGARSDADTIVPEGLSTICAPMVQDGHVLGVIAIEKQERDFFTLRDLGMLQAVATMSGGALQAAMLVDQAAGVQHAGDSQFFQTREANVRRVFEQASHAAKSDVTVLITGESGTGKEVLARHVHQESRRGKGPFMALNCGAIPSELFESELFGYEKGAFTGAAKTTPGKVEAAEGGTLFLDEVGELSLQLQPKLLRFLQERAYYRVGGNRAIEADVRIISASNRNLEQEVQAGRFREDLWYRLNVINFTMPPLRERRADIAPMTQFLARRSAMRLNRQIDGINEAALEVLTNYDWPGNIRELENAVERAVLLARGRVLTATDFRHIADAQRRANDQLRKNEEVLPLAELERRHIIAALKRFQWNQARAAEALGIHRNTLRNKIAEYGISPT